MKTKQNNFPAVGFGVQVVSSAPLTIRKHTGLPVFEHLVELLPKLLVTRVTEQIILPAFGVKMLQSESEKKNAHISTEDKHGDPRPSADEALVSSEKKVNITVGQDVNSNGYNHRTQRVHLDLQKWHHHILNKGRITAGPRLKHFNWITLETFNKTWIKKAQKSDLTFFCQKTPTCDEFR